MDIEKMIAEMNKGQLALLKTIAGATKNYSPEDKKAVDDLLAAGLPKAFAGKLAEIDKLGADALKKINDNGNK